MARKRGRAPQPSGALHTPEGEVKRRSAKVADEALPPRTVGGSALVFDAEKSWLIETLESMGAEKPSVSLVKGSTWVCRDGRKTLGRVAMGDVLEQKTESVRRVFDLRGAVTLTIDRGRAPDDLLWAVATLAPHVQRQVVLGLLRGDNGEVNPSTWAYRRGNEVLEQWNANREKNGKPAVRVGSAIIVAATRRAADQFARWRKSGQLDKAPPWPKSVGFDLDDQGINVQRLGEGKNLRRRIVASIRILGMDQGKRPVQPVLRVTPRGGSAWATMRRLFLDPERFKMRSARVVNDRGKWLLKLSYTMPRPGGAGGSGALVVRRGMGRFLISQGSDGRVPLLYDGGKGSGIIAIKRQMHARRCVAREHLQHQGKGARGHGRARFWRIMTRLDNAEARYVKTWCQQQAAKVVRAAKSMGYAEIIVEDFAGSSPPVHPDPFVQKLLRRFPFAMLRESIEWAAKKAGIPTRAQALDYDPHLCPECNAELVRRERNGWCACECGFAAWEDTVVCWHHLKSAGVETTLKKKAEKERKQKAAVEQAAIKLSSTRRTRTRRRPSGSRGKDQTPRAPI